ncbi:hypothetical protein FHT44_003524 [Mycolicibacterium sp. BK634]|uniref:hypothetical protein n=1 Tax=Mycolicibacterium sp. BK634 TaxID=2587099 RepID=UPI00160D47DE|nr:hypothetical protein [Mycolicibacterium sp. BK634]MBB3751029.1 hypothetical protein [Mycolicibacterium sp. BK634]
MGIWSRARKRLAKQWNRHATAFAGAFAALALVFAFVAAIQSIELHDRHLFVEWGTVPAWLAGLGAFASFGVLALGLREWNTAQRERRDRDADQARLIIAEPLPLGAEAVEGDFVIRNHSQAPVFDVDCYSLLKTRTVRSAQQHEWIQMTLRKAVLQPGQATDPYVVEEENTSTDDDDSRTESDNAPGTLADWIAIPSVELVTFEFTDALGRPWRRTGSGQPIRQLSKRRPGTSLEDVLKRVKIVNLPPLPPPEDPDADRSDVDDGGKPADSNP